MDKRIFALVGIVTVFLLIMTSFSSVADVQSETISSSKKLEKIRNAMILEYAERLKEIKSIKELFPAISNFTHLFQPEINSYFQKIVRNISFLSNECGCETTDLQNGYPFLLCAFFLYSIVTLLIIAIFFGYLTVGLPIPEKIFWNIILPFIANIIYIIEYFAIFFNCPTYSNEQYHFFYEQLKPISINFKKIFSNQQIDVISQKIINKIFSEEIK